MKKLVLGLAVTLFSLQLTAQNNCETYFEYDEFPGCRLILFEAVTSASGIDVQYSWDFGDGTTSNEAGSIHTFEEDGIYNVCLVVTYPTGCVADFCETVEINCSEPCGLWIESSYEDCPKITFEGYSSSSGNIPGEPFNWNWDFGDGSTGLGSVVQHNYTNNGTYTVCLSYICDNGVHADHCEEITIDCYQTTCESYFQYTAGDCPTVQFYGANSTGGTEYEYFWEFGDGHTSTQQNPVHTYQENSWYTPCLIITTADGCTSTYCDEIFFECGQEPCFAQFAYENNCPDVEFFVAIPSNGTPNTIYWWDFGDGTEGEGLNPVHTYEENGVYQACLTVICEDGTTEAYCELVFIDCLPPNCEAWFEYSQQDCPTIEFWANNVIIGPTDPIIWTWHFGDGTTSTGQNPVHTYEYNGVYTVCLVVTTPDGCNAEFCNEIFIECVPRPCHAFFDYVLDCPAAYFFVVLPPDVAPGTEYIWDFGDGTTGSGWEPIHVYEENGTYEVCLTVICEDGSVEEYCQTVIVNCVPSDCQAWFEYSLEDCPTVQFYTSSAGTPVDGYNYYWDFGDGTTGTGSNPEHTYCSNGTYTVCLVVITDDGCAATQCEVITIDCIAPACSAHFGYNITDDCPAVQFHWEGPDPTPNDLIEWQWIFGDGTMGDGPNPTHTYETSGVHTVCLVVTTADGCTAAQCREIVVQCDPPSCEAYFEYDQDDCSTIQFYGLNSTDPVPTPNNFWFWDFGDDTYGYGPNPVHTYTESGVYFACLTIECDDGIASTYCEEIWIDCVPPGCNAGFQYVVEDCPTVHFYGATTVPPPGDEADWFWEFGDGTAGYGPDPVHTYGAGGVYTVCLVVTTANGCTATYCDEVIVDCGPPNCQAYFEYDHEDCSSVQFYSPDTSPPGTTSFWHWEFGDGHSSDEPNPIHSYNDNGVYSVCLTVVTPDGCTAVWCDLVWIECDYNECEAFFDFSRQDCPDVAFFAGINNPAGNGEYHWDFGDGSMGYGPNPIHTYTQNASYDVCLTVITSSGCAVTHCEEVRINCLRHGLIQSWISTVRAFPNPSTDRVVIEFEEEREEVSWSLSGVDGNEYEIRAVGNGDGFDVDLEGLTKGIYFLNIKAGDDSGTIKLFKY